MNEHSQSSLEVFKAIVIVYTNFLCCLVTKAHGATLQGGIPLFILKCDISLSNNEKYININCFFTLLL
ncbi:hypothetical protein PB70LOC_03369 [Pectobacterium versatile]|nr:hypothetical protein PB70LOC_03369 [Pectobacterium versatile]POY61639.1 hypothetical protein PB69LOC_03608 [Pectobacterium versatile]